MLYINSFVFAIDVIDVINNVWLSQDNFDGRSAVMRRVTPAARRPFLRQQVVPMKTTDRIDALRPTVGLLRR